MRIDVLSYVDPARGTGGGEMSMRGLLDEALRRGHSLRLAHRHPEPHFDRHKRADLSIVADVWNLPGHWRRPDRRLARRLGRGADAHYAGAVARVLETGRFVHHDNAYVDVCSRPYLPCSGEVAIGGECTARGGKRCRRLRDERLYRRAVAISFVSPLHARVVCGMLGEPLPPALVLRPLVDPQRFRPLAGTERDLDRLYVGPLVEGKGVHELRRRYPRGDVWVAGPGRPSLLRRLRDRANRQVGFGRPLGRVEYEDVPVLLNRVRTFVFLPRWPEPQGRVVIEAALCGCELEVNDRVGALSFAMPPDDPALSAGAADEWWRHVEEVAAAT